MREKKKTQPKSRARYATEEAWQNAQESKRRYCRRYYREHKAELNAEATRKQKLKRDKERPRKEKQRQRFKSVKAEFGPVVIKLHFMLKMRREGIYELLGGLVSRTDIAAICNQERKRLDSLEKRRSKKND